MENLNTSPDLIDRMQKAAKSAQSEKLIREQMVSFIIGAVNSDNGITKERVEEVLARHEGRTQSIK